MPLECARTSMAAAPLCERLRGLHAPCRAFAPPHMMQAAWRGGASRACRAVHGVSPAAPTAATAADDGDDARPSTSGRGNGGTTATAASFVAQKRRRLQRLQQLQLQKGASTRRRSSSSGSSGDDDDGDDGDDSTPPPTRAAPEVTPDAPGGLDDTRAAFEGASAALARQLPSELPRPPPGPAALERRERPLSPTSPPQQQQQRWRDPERRLTWEIGAAQDWRGVRALVEPHYLNGGLNAFHIAAALSRLAHVHQRPHHQQRQQQGLAPGGRGLDDDAEVEEEYDDGEEEEDEEAFIEQLIALSAQQWRRFDGSQVTATLWALARLDASLTPELEAAALDAVLRGSGGNSGGGGKSLTPLQAATCAWALARLSVLPPPAWLVGFHGALPALLPALQPQPLSMLFWALGQWRSGSGGGEGSNGAAAARLPTTPPTVPADVADALLHAARRSLSGSTPQGLAVVLWAATRLGLRPDASWLAAWRAEFGARLADANGHDLSVALWALATLQAGKTAVATANNDDAAFMAAAVDAAAALAPRGTGAAELPCLLWALASLRYRPPPAAGAALLRSVAAHAAAGALSPQGISLSLLAAVKLRLPLTTATTTPPPPLSGSSFVAAMLGAAYELLPLFAPSEAVALLLALAKARCIPPDGWMDAWWGETATALPRFSAQNLSNALLAAVRLGQAPPRRWIARWLTRSGAALARREFSAQGLAMLLPAFAALEAPPPAAWQREFWAAAGDRGALDALDALGAERLLWAAAALRAPPPPAWAPAYFDATARLLPTFTPHNLGNALWAAAVLRLSPPAAWTAGAAARLDALVAAGAYEDAGLGRDGGLMTEAAAAAAAVAIGGGDAAGAAAARCAAQRGARLRVALANTFWALEELDMAAAARWAHVAACW